MLLVIYFFLFICYFIRDACTSVRVAQRVCVYEWTIIYISGIVIANIYCVYIVILYGKVCMVKIVCPHCLTYDSPIFISPYKPCVTFSYLFHSFTLGLYSVLGFVFHKGKFY